MPDSPTSPTRARRPARRLTAKRAVALAAGAIALAGCNMYPDYGANPGQTTQGHETFKLYSGMMSAGIVVFAIVAVLILWSILVYRRKGDEIPRQFHENIILEVIYTAIPIILVFGIFAFTVLTENEVTATVPANATVTANGTPVVDITVTAFQWGWRFDYPGQNVSVTGELRNGPGNLGPQMVVPAGQTVQVTLVSNDVIHGFYVRDFNFSRYAQPGFVNTFDLTVNNVGVYDGQCTQYCGLYHAQMLFTVKAVPPADFQSWAANEAATGHTIGPSGSGAFNNQPPGTRISTKNSLSRPSVADTAKAAA